MSKLSRRGFLQVSLGASAVIAGKAKAEDAPAETTPTPTTPVEHVRVDFKVNGHAHSVNVDADARALDVIRERLGLTGTKQACGHGACGACAVLLGDTPVCSCILPATALHAQQVTTIEGIGTPDSLHPMQRAFLAEDALQCGFCTPGFIVEASAFHDRWRAEHGDVEPSRAQVAAALAGHLCRCGAYPAIYRAVQGACAGRFDGDSYEIPRWDGLAKVTGTAKYTVDIQLPGQLEGRILRSTYGHGVLSICDTTAAEAMTGVKAVVVMTPVGHRVRFAGQELVAIAAVNAHIADQALRAIVVELDKETVVTTIDQALAADAPLIYPEKKPNDFAISANEGPPFPAPWNRNLRGPLSASALARPRKAARAPGKAGEDSLVLERTFETSVQMHTALEPHSCVAHWEAADKLTIYLSTQSVSDAADDVSERWELPRENVRVLADYIGGAFGAKTFIQPHSLAAIELAKAAGAPVRVVLSREEELIVGGLRPGERMETQLVVDPEGEPAAMNMAAYADAGVAVSNTVALMWRMSYHHVPMKIVDYDVVTNGPPGKPFRGPGGPQGHWALEALIDEVADIRGEDPLALRMRWDPNPHRQRLYKWAAKIPAWAGRASQAADKGRFRYGIGLGSAVWWYIVQPSSQAQLTVGQDGIIVSSATQDMGNGTKTMMARAAAKVFGLPHGDISVRIGDSDFVHGPLSGGSRTTPSLGPVVTDVCQQAVADLVPFAATHFSLEGATPVAGGIQHTGGHLPWAEVLKATPRMTYTAKRKRDEGGFLLPFEIGGFNLGMGIPASVQLTEVIVDTRLGRIIPQKVHLGVAVGQILCPRLARSQCEGGVVQSTSYALYEERHLDPLTGVNLTHNLEDYRLMGIGDVPEIEVHFDEEGWDHVQGRALGLAELATIAGLPAMASAVTHATGWRPDRFPLTAPRVLGALS
jgi:xanthine dehydrogenase YagR molybdenum-binding subunit